jgi:hypothetical protein
MSFPTTYSCEQALSQLFHIKLKYRNRMSLEPQPRLKLPAIELEIRYNSHLIKQVTWLLVNKTVSWTDGICKRTWGLWGKIKRGTSW